MDPQRFDGTAGLALGLLLPLSVLFVASGIRVSRAPWWTWLVFLAAAGGLLVNSSDLDWTRYPEPLVDDDYGRYDGGQFLGFLLGWAGVAVNAAVSAVHGLVTHRRRRSSRRFTSLEARLLTASSLALAAACATPAAWWSSGAGLPPWPVPVLPAAIGLVLAVIVSVRGHRRGLGLDTPVSRVASAIVGCMLAVAVVSSGSGGPDVSLVPDAAPEPTPTSTPDRVAHAGVLRVGWVAVDGHADPADRAPAGPRRPGARPVGGRGLHRAGPGDGHGHPVAGRQRRRGPADAARR